MPRALITGLEGFTGHYLAEALRSVGFDVVGTTLKPSSNEEGLFTCDLLDQRRLKEVVNHVHADVVVHLAAVSFVAHGEPGDFYRTNIGGARNLLEALAGSGRKPESVLLASSASVYGNPQIDLISESSPPSPQNDYAVSKYAMELMANLWKSKLPIVVTRPFNYTGVGQAPHFLLPKIVDHFRSGAKEIQLGNLDIARDFSDVRSVAEQYSRLVTSECAGEIFNVCSGKSTSLSEIMDIMADIAGYRIDVAVNPDFVRENEVKTLRGANAKIAAVIGDPGGIPISHTLRWMFESGGMSVK